MSDLNTLSENLLLTVKKEGSYDHLLQELASIDLMQVEAQLKSDPHKNSFWINIYNAFFQILRKDRGLKQPKIYTKKELFIAGKAISLDDIEHGILRRYRYKYSLGYFPNPFIDAQIKKWAVSKVDFRIHFALNCGAVSCPPIAFYSFENLKKQLEHASLSFLEHETQINEEKKVVHVSKLFLWFHKDFNGNSGTKEILTKYLGKDFSGFRIKYNQYSWEESIDNYDEDSFEI